MKGTAVFTRFVVTGTLWACFGLVTPAGAYPPDPDNAALLYYQAFLLIPQSDDRAVKDLVVNVVNGGATPNEQVKQYLGKCRDSIDCALAATELPHCNWGLRYSRGFSAAFPHLAQVRSLSRLILADARILAVAGDHRQALERCLATYRLAGHVGDETLISFLVSVALSDQANRSVMVILEQMPAEADTLTWLKGQLAIVPTAKLTVNRAMTLEEEMASEYLRPERIVELIGLLSGPSGMSTEEIRKAVDEGALERAQAHYSNYKRSAHAILSGQTPYGESYAKLQELTNQMEQAAVTDPAAKLIQGIAPAMAKIYLQQMYHQADFNALLTAIDVYLARASSGRWPSSLPAASPRDPYTGNEFKYEPTAKGFVLRCGAKDLGKNEVREYRFTTK